MTNSKTRPGMITESDLKKQLKLEIEKAKEDIAKLEKVAGNYNKETIDFKRCNEIILWIRESIINLQDCIKLMQRYGS